MNRLLILTKNISVERYFQEQLQKLNYEVLVSVSIWENWVKSRELDPFIKSFQWIFLSETISDNEVRIFSDYLDSDRLVRIVEEEPNEATVTRLADWHILDWVLADASLERLREKMTHKNLLNQLEEMTSPFEQYKTAFPLYFSDIHFTKLEKKIIHQLMVAKNRSVSRDQLCDGWQSKNQNSKLSQLSTMINKIRKKVAEAYGINDAIHTVWGEGYQLNTQFYRCLLAGEYHKHEQKAKYLESN